VLLAILGLQAILSSRLENTAFEDEALYLYAGRMELAHIMHGAALPGENASYFSGAPVLYPVLAAALNAVGGLALARALSLFEMLAVTAMLYSISRSLFNERAALCAAAMLAVSEPVIFLGHLATFDATCLFLLASATWIVVRWSGSRWPVFLLAAPLVALAVAVKYAGVLFVPTIAVLPAIVGWPARGRRALLYPPAFAALVAGLLYGALRLGGHVYDEAISASILSRPQGGVSALVVARESAAWGGVIMVLALVGAITVKKRRALAIVLAGTAFLAPAYQMCLHTDTSLLKHVGFGLFFGAPLAGVGLVRLVGDRFARRQAGTAAWCIALLLGMSASWSLYHSWPSSRPLINALSPYLRPGARYLVEVPEVPIYYLQGHSGAQPAQFWSTSAITYVNSKGERLTGDAGFAAAIQAGFFRLVAYTGYATPATDEVIVNALDSSPLYQLTAVLHLTDSNGPVNYYVWVAGLGSHAELASVTGREPMLGSWTRARNLAGRHGSRTSMRWRQPCRTSPACTGRQATLSTR
jgi:Dolichyl-phosphate-mannose-protein mannosyltransferase